MSVPMSQIRICTGVRLNNDYQHTIWFDNHDKQKEYFMGKVDVTFPNYTYLRKNWSIKVDVSKVGRTVTQAMSWNYLFFSNSDSAKFWFYFITDVQYISDNTVELSLEMDVMQTYQFDYNLNYCMVEREHVSSDEPSEWLMDEGLELGELVSNVELGDNPDIDLDNMCVVILSSINPNNGLTTLGGTFGKIFSGLNLYAVASSQFSNLIELLSDLDEGKSDGIFSMWMYPKKMVVIDENDGDWDNTSTVAKRVRGIQKYEYTFSKDFEDVDGWTPANKKLFAYPYNFLYVTNNAGGSAVYKYEYFGKDEYGENDDICKFILTGANAPDASVYLYPLHYKGTPENYDEGLSGSPFPVCAWAQDTYKMWLAQNQNQQTHAMNTANFGAFMSIAGAAGMAATQNWVGAGASLVGVVSAYNQATQLMAQRKDAEIQPPQSKGQHSASVNVNEGKQGFTITRKTIDFQHAMRLDEYFTMYGYKCCRVKIPNRRAREEFTFTKTIGCSIEGDICASDKRKIEGIFNNGVTFWVNGDHIGDYNRSNNPLY